ncbi:helix-turn-helix transcriptional regulator [Bacillus cereus]|uniref:Helix-turn-helix transcriptional regulator n=1 Tax=Bacillus cereus TaxID=1396 RepID=A0AAW4QQB3_BACCE|nr:helix-turn-helix transcriptional regulator [Bacillus cereus]MBY0036916.1 helix-turn-helix transcriptional regulator [Bacillus cereus]MED3355360.1 helix-turn-helix transcriptional regulator [Bacillus thuringiensis]HDR4903673.1 helix-turn-helix transcriptional regulator [Bacillus cereus]
MLTSERIKYQRKLNKLTQKELADKLDVSSQVISNWERDYTRPNYDDIGKLANVFKVTSDYLLGRVSSPEGFIIDHSKALPPSQYDPQVDQYNNDKNNLFKTVALAYEHNEPLPIIVDKENKVNIQVYKENGLTLNAQDTRELTAMINGFLYGKKFVSREDEDNISFEDTYNDENKNY